MGLAGCNFCDEGFKLKSELSQLDQVVARAANRGHSTSMLCLTFRRSFAKELKDGSALAEKIARDYFYEEEHRCYGSRMEQQCYGQSYPPCGESSFGFGSGRCQNGYSGYPQMKPGAPNNTCPSVIVCDSYQVISHRRDGYDSTVLLASLLREINSELTHFCATAEQGRDDTEFNASVNSTRAKLFTAFNQIDVVLVRGGCSTGRRGD